MQRSNDFQKRNGQRQMFFRLTGRQPLDNNVEVTTRKSSIRGVHVISNSTYQNWIENGIVMEKLANGNIVVEGSSQKRLDHASLSAVGSCTALREAHGKCFTVSVSAH
jgi:hypothetical protein